ncbi:membrane protein [Salmonella enterica subsp. enterica]|uniref:Membrane protein n=1 Tax=Salmonella enterica I TaxID=59201 RepID=A0A379WML7_SALET|nr:membrane protein [Salmonella enterica subsp. enterica]
MTALADRLEHKNRAVPYAQIASIRTQREEGAGSSMSYLMISTATGRICKIDRSTIVNEPLLLNFLSQRLPRLTTFLYKDESMELYVSKTSQQNMPVEFNIYYSRF